MCFDSIHSKDNLVEKSGASRASGVRAQKKCTSDQRANEKLNWQGFKTHVNYALLGLRISTVFCSKSTITTTLTMQVYHSKHSFPVVFVVKAQ